MSRSWLNLPTHPHNANPNRHASHVRRSGAFHAPTPFPAYARPRSHALRFPKPCAPPDAITLALKPTRKPYPVDAPAPSPPQFRDLRDVATDRRGLWQSGDGGAGRRRDGCRASSNAADAADPDVARPPPPTWPDTHAPRPTVSAYSNT
eukprot:scaffold6354_cov126-Isochrysis_galbana.AAC.12